MYLSLSSFPSHVAPLCFIRTPAVFIAIGKHSLRMERSNEVLTALSRAHPLWRTRETFTAPASIQTNSPITKKSRSGSRTTSVLANGSWINPWPFWDLLAGLSADGEFSARRMFGVD